MYRPNKFIALVLCIMILVTFDLIEIQSAQASIITAIADTALVGIIALLIACGVTFENGMSARAVASAFYARYVGTSPNWFKGLLLLAGGQVLNVSSELWTNAHDFIQNYLTPAIVSGSDVVTVTGTAVTEPIPAVDTTILQGYYPLSTVLVIPFTYTVPNGAQSGANSIFRITCPLSCTDGTTASCYVYFTFNGTMMSYVNSAYGGGSLPVNNFNYVNNTFSGYIKIYAADYHLYFGLSKDNVTWYTTNMCSTTKYINGFGCSYYANQANIPSNASLTSTLASNTTVTVGTGVVVDSTASNNSANVVGQNVYTQPIDAVGGLTQAQLLALTGALDTGNANTEGILTNTTAINSGIATLNQTATTQTGILQQIWTGISSIGATIASTLVSVFVPADLTSIKADFVAISDAFSNVFPFSLGVDILALFPSNRGDDYNYPKLGYTQTDPDGISRYHVVFDFGTVEDGHRAMSDQLRYICMLGLYLGFGIGVAAFYLKKAGNNL